MTARWCTLCGACGHSAPSCPWWRVEGVHLVPPDHINNGEPWLPGIFVTADVEAATEAASARLLEAHRADQRIELVEQMLAKFRRDNPSATQAEVDRHLSELVDQLQRLPKINGGAR